MITGAELLRTKHTVGQSSEGIQAEINSTGGEYPFFSVSSPLNMSST